MNNRYMVVVGYDGSDYHGWQYQEGLPTIAGTMQDAFQRAFKKNISLLGTSRTDAGVHASYQVASFDNNFFVDAEMMRRVWNDALPPAINIREIRQVDTSFNVFAAQQKTYGYTIFLEKPLPIIARFGWYNRKKICFKTLDAALQTFVGTHDFKSFSTGDERGDDTVRTIDAIALIFDAQAQRYQIEVKGKKFLHHMVRRIVGASVDVATNKKLSVHFLQDVLAGKKINPGFTNAPARGLFLTAVTY